MGVKKLFDEGISGCIVTANPKGEIAPMFLSEFDQDNGVIQPRLVSIDSEFAQLCLKNLHYIRDEDSEALSKFIDNPEVYKFNEILNWN